MKKVFIGIAAAASMLTTLPASADLSVSGNLGVMSDYFYRGIFQSDSVANGGLDLEYGGFSLGTWAADVDDGLEVDVYGGYGHEFEGGFSASIGFTGYYYTGEFDDTYQELNFGVGWNFLSVDYAVGEYDNFDGPTQDYDFLSVSAEYNGLYALFGSFGDDFSGDYWEFGYGMDVAGFDVTGSIIINDKELSGTVDSSGLPDSDESFVLSISKSIDIM
ncbi:MAG: TorF family putative porin [Pseudomonadota bacterium]